jgi:soluble lytic murein transglycosylase-like protein
MLLSEWKLLIAGGTIWVGLSSDGLLAQASTDDRIRRVAAYFVQHYSRIYGIEPELVESIVEVESNWRPGAISPKGAAGLMQLMPQTARRFRVKNRFNIEQNIRGGVEYLAWCHKVCKGDLRLVTAAYVAGESRVIRRGLAYSCPEVFAYVQQVSRVYRGKLRFKQKKEGQS